jgi:hypothetical protein
MRQQKPREFEIRDLVTWREGAAGKVLEILGALALPSFTDPPN